MSLSCDSKDVRVSSDLSKTLLRRGACCAVEGRSRRKNGRDCADAQLSRGLKEGGIQTVVAVTVAIVIGVRIVVVGGRARAQAALSFEGCFDYLVGKVIRQLYSVASIFFRQLE